MAGFTICLETPVNPDCAYGLVDGQLCVRSNIARQSRTRGDTTATLTFRLDPELDKAWLAKNGAARLTATTGSNVSRVHSPKYGLGKRRVSPFPCRHSLGKETFGFGLVPPTEK
jgi:hypothetical protein